MAHDDDHHGSASSGRRRFSAHLQRLRERLASRLYRRTPPDDAERRPPPALPAPHEPDGPQSASERQSRHDDGNEPRQGVTPPPVILMPAEPPVATAEEIAAPAERQTRAADDAAARAASVPRVAEPPARDALQPDTPAPATSPVPAAPPPGATAVMLGSGIAGPTAREATPWGPRRRARNGFQLALQLAQRPGFCCCCWCLGPHDTRRAKRIFAIVRAVKRAERGLPPRRAWPAFWRR